jgi:hypothetical protein
MRQEFSCRAVFSLLFQNKKVVIDVEVGKKYLQGQRIGEIR